MLQRIALTSLAFLILTATASVSADEFRPRISVPKNFTDFQAGVQEVKDNIETVQCGGWARGTDAKVIGNSVQGDVPIPEIYAHYPDGTEDPIAIPGRDNVNPLGSPTTGIGTRGVFQFPDTAFGFASACDMYITSSGDLLAVPPGPHTEAQTMYDEDLDKILHKNIDFKNTPCDGPDPCIAFDGGSVRLVDGNGKIQINPYNWCIRWDNATPKHCRQLASAWRAMSQLPGIHIPVQSMCDCESVSAIPHDKCPPRPRKRYCFDPINTFICTGTSARYSIFDTIMETSMIDTKEGKPEIPAAVEFPRNDTCRTDWLPFHYNKITECEYTTVITILGPYGVLNVKRPGEHLSIPSSIYRHYAGGFMQPGVHVRFGTGALGTLRGECYEYYKETNKDLTDFDPQTTVTAGRGDGGGKDNDEQCELVLTNEMQGWPDLVGHKQLENVPDPDPPVDPLRPSRNAADPWVLDDQTNLSVIDIVKLKELQKDFDDPGDITGVIGSIVEAKQRASKTVRDNIRTDMFDDADHRSLSAYWEAQEKALLVLTRAPTVRLIMPARFIAGLDDDNPLFQYVQAKVSKPNGTVELTLRAGPEDIGNVLSTFKRSYIMPLSEVRIPILVPLASKGEIDKLIFEWKHWKQLEDADAQNANPPRASFSGEADPILAKLQEYSGAILSQRKLRNALDKELIGFLSPLKQIDRFMANWYQDNTQKLKEAAMKNADRLRLKRVWRHIQNSMLQADQCQLQWCSNMRYSIAVYSLLDKWWGDAALRSPRNSGYVPPDDLQDLIGDPPKDQLYDFSFLAPARGEFKIPVLWPIQVKIKLPRPPLLGTKPEAPGDFPSLPTLPDAAVFDEFSAPTVNLPAERVLGIPPSMDLAAAIDTLMKFRVMIDGTQIGDQEFESQWEEESNDGIVADEGTNFSLDRNNMRGSYCRFIKSVLVPSNPDKGDPERILHVENDLKERVARLYSRWLPERTEDLAGRTLRVRNQFPLPAVPKCKEDVICAFLPGQRTTVAKWATFLPTADTDFTDIADTLRFTTLPSSDSQSPYENATLPVLERLFPWLTPPVEIDLRPTTSL
ncbi:hypothetical protein EXS65_00690 [Candidatus Peribacteria bacterium]|nr:hypothetical protein [Candidatus Peribacteria bacterium]